MSSPAPPRFGPGRALLLLGIVLFLLALAGRGLVLRTAATRLQRAAADRGLSASWGSLRLGLPATIHLHDLIMTSQAGDTLVRAGSLTVEPDLGSLLMLSPRVRRLSLAHATVVRHQTATPALADTLVEEEAPAQGASAARVRRAAETLVRLMLAPARRLPELDLRDVILRLSSASDDDGVVRGARLERLELRHATDGLRLSARGGLELERLVPFDLSLAWRHDDRLAGGATLGIPDTTTGARHTLTLVLDGAVRQDRPARRITIAPGTRLRIGTLPLALGGRIEARGPRVHLTLDALGIGERELLESVPAPVLGPLADLAVRGSFDYHAALDLDLARPDSVSLAADVVPHDLAIDAARTGLPILGLDGPFVAEIHLPRGRIVTRELSPANPSFRPLATLDPWLVYAVLTNEDGAFFRHRGFNLEAVRMAIAANLKAGAYRRGAGTITMQLARNLWLGHERSLSRKAQEVVLAWVVEHLTGLSKDRLLEIYLNIIEWGPGVHGATEACRYYFDHDPDRVTIDEALFLATVVPAPSRWHWRFDRAGELRPYARAQMHFIGRAMVAKGWLAADHLPPADSLRVQLRGLARERVVPEPAPGDTLPATPATPVPVATEKPRPQEGFALADFLRADSLSRRERPRGERPSYWVQVARRTAARDDLAGARRAMMRALQLEPSHPEVRRLARRLGLRAE